MDDVTHQVFQEYYPGAQNITIPIVPQRVSWYEKRYTYRCPYKCMGFSLDTVHKLQFRINRTVVITHVGLEFKPGGFMGGSRRLRPNKIKSMPLSVSVGENRPCVFHGGSDHADWQASFEFVCNLDANVKSVRDFEDKIINVVIDPRMFDSRYDKKKNLTITGLMLLEATEECGIPGIFLQK